MRSRSLVTCGLLASVLAIGCGDDTGSGGAGAGGSADGAGGAESGGGGSGGGGGAECTSPSDCPDPEECLVATCEDGVCGTSPVDAGVPVEDQDEGDCQELVCDGAGNVESVDDDTDEPNDGQECTIDSCAAGQPDFENAEPGTECGKDLSCNAAGRCAGCTVPDQCPGEDTECATRTCEASVCDFDYADAGTLLTAQPMGDCKTARCNGSGGVVTEANTRDPFIDNLDCTFDQCDGDTPDNPPVADRLECDDNGGVLCSAGECVECIEDEDCGESSDCRTYLCAIDGTCGSEDAPPGAPVEEQIDGDCQLASCNGMGGIDLDFDMTDLPDDGDDCTVDLCVAGMGPDHEPAAVGAPCDDDGGAHCNAAGDCVECTQGSHCASLICGAGGVCQAPACDDNVRNGSETDVDCGGSCGATCDNAQQCSVTADCATATCQGGYCIGAVTSFRVLRLGDGASALSNASAAGFLEERSLATGGILSTIPLPTSTSGANQAIAWAGSSQAEGAVTRSADGRYIVFAGYAIPPGNGSVATSSSNVVKRVVGRVDRVGVVNTTTTLGTAYSGTSIRGATSTDGTVFWASGTGSDTGGGFQYATLGATSSTGITGILNNTRVPLIWSGQLYGSAGATSFTNVFTVGTGLPTAPSVSTPLPGMPTTGGSPYGFVFFDMNPNIAGPDLLYVADDRSQASGGGIQQWNFDGTTWTLDSTITTGFSTGVRGLLGYLDAGVVNLVATTTTNSANIVVRIVDGPSLTATTLATAGANTVFRGVALSPQVAP